MSRRSSSDSNKPSVLGELVALGIYAVMAAVDTGVTMAIGPGKEEVPEEKQQWNNIK